MRLLVIPLLAGSIVGPVVLGGAVLAATGLALAGLATLKRDSLARSGGLMVVLTGFFVIFSRVIWSDGRSAPASSAGVLVLAVLVFRLMAAFEPATPPPAPKRPEKGHGKP